MLFLLHLCNCWSDAVPLEAAAELEAVGPQDEAGDRRGMEPGQAGAGRPEADHRQDNDQADLHNDLDQPDSGQCRQGGGRAAGCRPDS